MDFEGWGPRRWASHFNQMLNLANPPDRYRFDIGALAMETSRSLFPEDPITKVGNEELDGFAGALVPSASRTRWGIVYGAGQSRGRRRFTIAHEFGHYLLHRKKYPDGIHSSEAGIDGRTRLQIEREANEFASWLLMPLDDFRRQVPPMGKPDFDVLGDCAERYDVSLVAAILQWLRYTERRALLVVSVDGFVKWSWSSERALTTGAFIRTSRGPMELPPASAAGRELFTPEARTGVDHPTGVWFDEPARELSFKSERYDAAYTLLYLGDDPGWNRVARRHSL
ncbi:ImmA/IrrE family metallo-endopeptidase [Bradyrhizobium diazoefficiens]|nr:ImmA/IrrE family metallo-endopeptidase [Bradyrhizobium diazoefficiens]QQN63441.1 ImmA/IrrE family metallo-endopeptidase [Bradyrhizobium diazoefficiens]